VLVSCRDDGAGAAVVLLHSGVTDGRAWEPQAEVLRRDHRVIRPDLRGFGRTPLPPEAYTDAGDVVALLDHLDVVGCHLVGSSLGGRVALEVARAHPDRVASLVLLCPAFAALEPTPAVREFGAREDALLEAGDIDAAVELNLQTWLGPEASAQTRELVRQMQRHAFEVQQAANADPDFPWPEPITVDPAGVTAPTLAVSGDHDLDHFRAIARHLASTIPQARLVTLPWAAHLPAIERPDEITRLLQRFLADRATSG